MTDNNISRPLMKAPLAGTPQDSVNAYNNRNAIAQADLANAVGGKKRRYRKRSSRGGGAVAAPYMAVPYPVSGAGGQDPNSIMYENAANQNQAAANRVYDKEAAVLKGGFLRRGVFKTKKTTRKGRKGRTGRKSMKSRRKGRMSRK